MSVVLCMLCTVTVCCNRLRWHLGAILACASAMIANVLWLCVCPVTRLSKLQVVELLRQPCFCGKEWQGNMLMLMHMQCDLLCGAALN